jgi:hypothetical protein
MTQPAVRLATRKRSRILGVHNIVMVWLIHDDYADGAVAEMIETVGGFPSDRNRRARGTVTALTKEDRQDWRPACR